MIEAEDRRVGDQELLAILREMVEGDEEVDTLVYAVRVHIAILRELGLRIGIDRIRPGLFDLGYRDRANLDMPGGYAIRIHPHLSAHQRLRINAARRLDQGAAG